MTYTTYIDLLNAVASDGELISPSDVSANRSLETKELTNVQLKLDVFKQCLIDVNEVKYLEKEFDWFLSNQSFSFDAFQNLKDLSEKLIGCTNRDGPNSNYGELCLRKRNDVNITQLEWVVDKLKHDKSTRQAVAFYNSPVYQYQLNSDFVCTLTQMFNIKNDRLNTTVNIRSNDLINCFRFDSIWYKIFQKIVINELKDTYPDLKEGYLFCNIYSAHYYLKDEHKLEQIRKCEKNGTYLKINSKYL